MGQITFILGGARSGKSTYALELAKKHKDGVAFIATAQGLDSEMRKRIRLHRKTRPSHWKTFEEPQDLPTLLKKIGDDFKVVVIDCLTLWVSNILLKKSDAADIIRRTSLLVALAKQIKGEVIIVSNEVGLGIVPNIKVSRDFRDIAGRVNQIVAASSNKVFFMVSGLPLKVK